ncbi:hypothetical protein Mth01_51740 [Sphaerimonospora thailandensis]|uniref:Uncharacterized protein n=1 Tax=Sphaerimonospora thailandensis TaxID=795644 RepID=A0A8J3REQ9_9ACTN|nr:hypothetical protein Mth01_51740 [Sphaerimonospora thailandensis]
MTLARASSLADCTAPCSTDAVIDCMRNTPSTTTTAIDSTSVLVTTRNCSERRQLRRSLPAARRARLRTPRAIWPGVRRRDLAAEAGMLEVRCYAGPAL